VRGIVCFNSIHSLQSPVCRYGLSFSLSVSRPPQSICFYDLPHLFPLPKERTNRRQISVRRKIVRPIPPPEIPKTRRTFLLLPGEKAGMRAVVKIASALIPRPFVIVAVGRFVKGGKSAESLLAIPEHFFAKRNLIGSN
jgi:hypothetical protein